MMTRENYSALIADAYRRMASNTDPSYRKVQKAKCDEWLAEMEKLYAADPAAFMTGP